MLRAGRSLAVRQLSFLFFEASSSISRYFCSTLNTLQNVSHFSHALGLSRRAEYPKKPFTSILPPAPSTQGVGRAEGRLTFFLHHPDTPRSAQVRHGFHHDSGGTASLRPATPAGTRIVGPRDAVPPTIPSKHNRTFSKFPWGVRTIHYDC